MQLSNNFYIVRVLCILEMVLLVQMRPQSRDTQLNKSRSNTTDVYYEHSIYEDGTHNETNANLRSASSSASDNIKFTNSTSRERVRILTHPGNPNRNRGSIETDDESDDQDIIFPDSIELFSEPISRIDRTPTCAEGSTFCENIETYPYNHLKDVLRKTKSHNDLFGMDETPAEITNRIGEQSEETYICGATDRTVYPKVGKTKNNKWKYIINQGDNDGYVQGVRIEMCKTQNRPCDLIGSLPNGYTTTCKQKFVYRRMLAISEGGQPVPDTFLMPSACCCSYKRDTQYLARFGTPTSLTERRK